MSDIKVTSTFSQTLFRILRVNIPYTIGGIICILLLDAIDMLPSLITKNLITDLHQKNLRHPIFYYGLAVILCYFLIALLRLAWRFFIIFPARQVEVSLRKEIFSKIFLTPFSQIKKIKPGDVVSIISQDIPNIRMLIGPGLIVFFDSLAYLIFIPVTLFYLLGWSSIYLLAPFSILFFAAYFLHHPMEKKHKRYSETQGKMSQHVFEEISGVRLFRSFHLTKARSAKYQNILELLFKDQLTIGKLDLLIDLTIQIVIMCSYVAVIVLALKNQNSKALSISLFAVSLQLLDKLTWPVSSLGHLLSFYQSARAAISRMNTVLDLNKKSSRGTNKPDLMGDMVLHDLNLKLNNQILLKNINLHIKKGMKIGIVGKIGSGKSLLLELLAGLYEKNELEYQEFSIGKNDLYSIHPEHLHEFISFIPQVPQLFSTTLEKNIILQNHPHQERLKTSFRTADFETDLENLKLKEKTFIGERGINLSGGQKQRVLVARSMYQDSQFLLWDDVISGLDSATEDKIIKNIVKKNHYAFVLATHRISSLIDFDLILVLDHGEITSRGTYSELKDSSALFNQLLQEEMIIKDQEEVWIQ